MRTTRLTPKGKLVVFIFIAAIVFTGVYFAGGLDILKDIGKDAVAKVNPTGETVLPSKSGKTNDAINISLDEWIGWKPILDANGGLSTKQGSIFDQLGIKVNISIINDATQSSNALVKGDINAAGYTINRYAFLYPKFKENNTPVRMVYITNYSNGGDGIIGKSDIDGINGLVGKTIAIPRYSEAQTLVEWLISKSNLSDADKGKINKVMFNTPDDAAKAYFGGQVDAAATWQPYLSQAQTTTGAKVIFSTKAATNLILDGIVFRKDFLDSHKDVVLKFVEGAIRANDLYKKEFGPIKNSMPLFATETDENISAMADDAALCDYSENVQLFGGVVQTLFTDMSNIWDSLGEKSLSGEVGSTFDNSIIGALGDKFELKKVESIKFTEEQRNTAKAQDNNKALMTQKLSISFETGASAIQAESFESLNKFADTAKILNGVIIQIEGNTDNVGNAAANQKLSQDRASSVAKYLQYQGIDPTRFVVVGNGQDKPIADNNTQEGKAANRRTDVFFKIVQ